MTRGNTDRRRIVVRLQGGLGNQLFQVAAARQLAPGRLHLAAAPSERAALAVVLPHLDGVVDHRRLLFYGIPMRTRSRLARRLMSWATWPIRRLRADANVHQSLSEAYDPPSPAALEAASRTRHTITMWGYFQHPAWIDRSAPVLADDIMQSLGLHGSQRKGSMAIHFRIRDYERFGHRLPRSYYEAALDTVINRSGCIHTVDIIGLTPQENSRRDVEDLIGHISAVLTVTPTLRFGNELDDFRTLATAQHLITSNSTFCWWAALVGDRLDDAADRVVCYADPWLRTAAVSLGRPPWCPVGVRW